MNMWIVTGIVVFKGQKRNDRAPWPCIVESDGGSKEDPTTRVPVDIFGDVEVGQRVELSGVLDSREWNGKRYLQLVVKSRKFDDTRPRNVNQHRYSEEDLPPSRNYQPMPEVDGELSNDNIPF